jgi:hypothetical protein
MRVRPLAIFLLGTGSSLVACAKQTTTEILQVTVVPRGGGACARRCETKWSLCASSYGAPEVRCNDEAHACLSGCANAQTSLRSPPPGVDPKRAGESACAESAGASSSCFYSIGDIGGVVRESVPRR